MFKLDHDSSQASCTLIAKHVKMGAKNKKCIAGYFAPLFSRFAPLFSLFAFHTILCLGRHSRKNSKDFVVYFFAALIKHKIRMKCESVQGVLTEWKVCEKYGTSQLRLEGPTDRYVQFISKLDRKHCRMLIGLLTGHINLWYMLHKMRRAETPSCRRCGA